jgi:hypothetical protein
LYPPLDLRALVNFVAAAAAHPQLVTSPRPFAAMPAGAARTLTLLVAVLQPASGLDNGAATRPPMGWLSWERWRCFVDCDLDPANCLGERLVLETAARMVQVRVTRSTSLVAPYGLYTTC